jgi:hypothetical protein
MKPVYTLENWAIIYAVDSPYTAPEAAVPCLVGDRNGLYVKTSRLLGKSGNYVVTQNSLYKLGEPDPEYEAAYPGARGRMFTSLQNVEV